MLHDDLDLVRKWVRAVPDYEVNAYGETAATGSTIDVAISRIEDALSKPRLGLATTLELTHELAARAAVANISGEDWPNYRTLGGDQGGYPD